MSENHCPICKKRVSDWMMATGKTEVIGSFVVHKPCLQVFKDERGRDWSIWEVAEQLSGGAP